MLCVYIYITNICVSPARGEDARQAVEEAEVLTLIYFFFLFSFSFFLVFSHEVLTLIICITCLYLLFVSTCLYAQDKCLLFASTLLSVHLSVLVILLYVHSSSYVCLRCLFACSFDFLFYFSYYRQYRGS